MTHYEFSRNQGSLTGVTCITTQSIKNDQTFGMLNNLMDDKKFACFTRFNIGVGTKTLEHYTKIRRHIDGFAFRYLNANLVVPRHYSLATAEMTTSTSTSLTTIG